MNSTVNVQCFTSHLSSYIIQAAVKGVYGLVTCCLEWGIYSTVDNVAYYIVVERYRG